MLTKLLLPLLVTLPCTITQNTEMVTQNMEMVYFPDGQGGLMNKNSVKLSTNFTESRVSNVYEPAVDRIIAGGIARLTLAINKVLMEQSADDNVVFAPVSIAGALALILLGSNGKTFAELTSVLGLTTGVDIESNSLRVHEQFARMINKLERTSDLDQQVNFASAVFVQNDYPIRQVYKNAVQDLYESEVLNVDFRGNPGKAQDIINSWVAQQTNNKITNILAEEPPSETRVIVTSAMYFKALWEFPFFEEATTKRPFFTDGRKSHTSIETEMMANGGEFPYFKDLNLNCEVMAFPYQGNASAMYVVMPTDSNAKKLRLLEETLTASDLERLADSTVYTRAVVLFPKMRLESTIDLKSSLELLGVKTLFESSQANLALLSAGEDSAPHSNQPVSARVPVTPNEKSEPIFFSRFSDAIDCSKNGTNNVNSSTNSSRITKNSIETNVVSQRIGGPVTGRITSRASETIDNLRRLINQQSTNNSYQNPGLYADKVIHKVYMDITETGTEAAASTSVSLSRDGSRVVFRVDVPFLFFIRNEETKTILFWGSVTAPTPNFKRFELLGTSLG